MASYKEKRMLRKLFALVLVLSVCGVCFADSEVDLGEIIITPFGMAVKSGLNPASVDVIDAQEALGQGKHTITDAIKDDPSVNYATTGSLGGVTGVNIRGNESHHTQVLLDGIALYDPIVTSSYFYGYNYMQLDNLSRIEVAKGPYSSVYGSGSIGGTINMTTRRGIGDPSFSFTQEMGSYQTYREILQGQGEHKKLAYSASVSRTDVNSFYVATKKNGNPEVDPYENLSSSLRLDYELTDDVDLGLTTSYTYAKYAYDGDTGWPFYFPADDGNNYARFYQGVGGLHFKQRLTDKLSHKLNLGYSRTYRKDWQATATNAWYNGYTQQLKWQGDYDICDSDTVLVGFDFLREVGESAYHDPVFPSTSPKRRNTSRGYYVENIFTPTDNIFFSSSYRIEDHSRFGTHNTFSVAGSIIIEPTNTKLKASVGEGFKAPSLYQLYDGMFGNSTLQPEESTSYEVGFEQPCFEDNVTFGYTYFVNDVKNLIQFSWPAGYMNSGKAKILGHETFIEYQLNESTKLGVFATHMHARSLSTGMRLLRRPNNKVTFKAETQINKWKLSGDISYVGNRMDSGAIKLKDYVLANASVSYQLKEWFEVYMRIENVFNQKYDLVNGYQTPKFSGYIGAKVDF